MSEDLVMLGIRAGLSAAFLYSGATKLFAWQTAAEEFSALGLPHKGLVQAGTISIQLSGGALLLTGFQTGLAAMALALFTLAASLIAHPFWTRRGQAFTSTLTTFLEHVGLIAGLVLISVTGPGRFSLDALA